jgi:hypothetical protein
VVAAWSAVALVGSYEVLMMVIRGSQVGPDSVPSVRAIRTQLHVGQPRAQ